jgi:hypothetical protein
MNIHNSTQLLAYLKCGKYTRETDGNCIIWFVMSTQGVGQGMKQTYLYLWYPLFQAQWDRCVQQNHQLLELHECIKWKDEN